MTRGVSVNLSPGILLDGNHESNSIDVLMPQFTAQLGVNVGGNFGLVVDMFTDHLRDRDTLGSPIETRDTQWHVGIRLGAVPGLITTLPALYLDALLQLAD